MSKIKIEVAGLPVAQRLMKGSEFINMGTANPNVNGNAALVAALSTMQAALQAAELAAEEARTKSKQCTTCRDVALDNWMAAVNNLASFTQSATQGDAGKILSAGFSVCASPSAAPVPGPVTGVTVKLNGTPGHASVSWNGVSDVDGYLLMGSADPITPTSWENPAISKKTKCDGNGAAPGEKYWYRVAAFNSSGQGPWSEPAARPVM